MPNKISLDSLDKVQLPDLEKESAEEELFQASEASTHEDHKLAKASQAALNTAVQKIRKLAIENDDLAMLGPHRRKYSWWILSFVFFFVITTFSILVLSSIQIALPQKNIESPFYTILNLDNEVLITLLATNTVQVVGLLFVVAKWLFPTKEITKSK